VKKRKPILIFTGKPVILYLEDIEEITKIISTDTDNTVFSDFEYEYDSLSDLIDDKSNYLKDLVIKRKSERKESANLFRFELSSTFPAVRLVADNNDHNELAFHKIKALLEEKQHFLSGNSRIFITLIVGISTIMAPINLVRLKYGLGDSTKEIISLPIIYLVTPLIVSFIAQYQTLRLLRSGSMNRVYLQHKKAKGSFYKRNKDLVDKLIVGILSAIAGGVIGAMLKR